MPSVTPTWQIPYAISTDPFCDGDLFIQQMAERVADILDSFDALVIRLITPPMAKIVVTVPNAVWSPVTGNLADQVVLYDSVEYDTDDMTNITFDPEKISYSRNGYWIQGGAINFTSSGNVDALVRASWVGSNAGVTAGRAIDFQARRTAQSHLVGSILKQYSNFGLPGLSGEVETDYNVSANVASIQVIEDTQMYVRWYSDL